VNAETPIISSSCYTSSVTDAITLHPIGDVVEHLLPPWSGAQDNLNMIRELRKQSIETNPTPMPNATRRIVQVFVADPNENVPLEHSVLFKGDQKLTDLTDTELYFEVPMQEVLKSHNDKRVQFLDKEASKRAGKDILLEPVKIRDLKMVVVTIAQF